MSKDELRDRCEEAYLGVLRALVVQQMDWGKENLMTTLRRELDITNEQHGQFLSQALDEVQTGKPPAKRQKVAASSGEAPKRGAGGSGRGRKRVAGAPRGSGPKRAPAAPTPPAAPAAAAVTVSAEVPAAPAVVGQIDKLVGHKVKRWWPQEGGWMEAVVTDFDPAKGLHCITYGLGTNHEQWEWYNIRRAKPEDCKVLDDKVDLTTGLAAVVPAAADPGQVAEAQKAKERIEAREEELKAQLLALEDDSDSDDTDDSEEEEE